MNKRTKFAITTIWILLSRSYDAFSTYQYTPDLSHEANPLASILGLGWTPILVIISLLSIYVVYAYYISTFKSYQLFPKDKGYSFGNFVAYCFLGKKAHWSAIFYKLPDSAERVHHSIGPILSRCFVYAGFLTTAMWLLINYSGFYPKYHNTAAVYTLLIVGCFCTGFIWLRQQYSRYKMSATGTPVY